MKRFLLTCLGFVLLGSPAEAQVPITADDTPVAENFNTFDGSGFAPAPASGQLDSDDFIARGFSDGDLDFGNTGTTGDFARGTGTGSVGTGGIYSFETTAGDFALGVQPVSADFTPGSFIVRYQNQTGGLIDDANVEYEINVYNDQNRSNSFNLRYASSATCATDPDLLTFTAVPEADYASPQAADATPSWQTISRGVYISGLSIANTACFYLQFTGDDVSGAGSRDEFALDNLTVTANPEIPLPVELTSFTALLDGPAVLLRWQTASETNNAGFEVHSKSAGADLENDWNVLGWVEGYGTTEQPQSYAYRAGPLRPGRHRFRLKQIDYDGAFAYSPEVEVAVGVPGAYHLSAAYPNPFHTATTFSLATARAQRVQVIAYTVTGRRAARLYDGALPEQTARVFTFDAAGLPGGLYLIQIVGEYFTAGQTVLLAK